MDELGQVNALMKMATNSHTVGIPVNIFHDGGCPLVPLLDVIEKQRTIIGVSDMGLVIVSNSSIGDL